MRENYKETVMVMDNYVLITDSTSDLPQKLADEIDVVVLPMQFDLDGLTYRHFADEREMNSEEFYDAMRSGKIAKTSQISVHEFCEHFSSYLEKGQDILYLSFSSGLSGTYGSSIIAIDELEQKYPERKILSVDTLAASMGEGLLVYYAAKMKKAGMGLEELAKWVVDYRLHLCHWFTVNDLHHLKRGGRVSAATAIVGSALNIKPVLHVDNEGHLINISKERGRKASLNALLDRMSDTYYTEGWDTVMIGHGSCRDDADYVASEIKKRFKGIKNVIIGNIGPVIGAHAGPGVLALFFMGETR